jgi:hypothetical protein
MAKFQDTVEILIAARDQATAEMRKVRQEVRATRAELGEQAGVVAGAAKFHATMLKVGAAAEGVKSTLVAGRAVTQAMTGDFESARESLKEMGFGIGEMVRQAEAIGTTIGFAIEGVTAEMLEAEAELSKSHEARLKAQERADEMARRAGRELMRITIERRRAAQLASAATEEDRAALELAFQRRDAEQRISELRQQAANARKGGGLREQVAQLALLASIADEEARLAERRAEGIKRQNELLKEQADAAREVLEARREEARIARDAQRERVRDFFVGSLRGTLASLREQRASIAGRGSTVSLGSQSGRFVQGLRDQAADREARFQQDVARKIGDMDRNIKAVEQAINKILNAMTGSDQVRLIPASFGAGRVF